MEKDYNWWKTFWRRFDKESSRYFFVNNLNEITKNIKENFDIVFMKKTEDVYLPINIDKMKVIDEEYSMEEILDDATKIKKDISGYSLYIRYNFVSGMIDIKTPNEREKYDFSNFQGLNKKPPIRVDLLSKVEYFGYQNVYHEYEKRLY